MSIARDTTTVCPQPQSIPLGPFEIYPKIRRDIRKSRFTTNINNTGGKIVTGINDTSGKFATGINNTAGKFATSFASVVEQCQAAETLK
jgi:hypothetical protein